MSSNRIINTISRYLLINEVNSGSLKIDNELKAIFALARTFFWLSPQVSKMFLIAIKVKQQLWVASLLETCFTMQLAEKLLCQNYPRII